uniref:DUF2828 domain-containing protein n=2 Tax=Schizophyllum commune (strain H4-8 / FGSC 9210) TaxID=578458 RepID=D8PPY1_SCHCM
MDALKESANFTRTAKGAPALSSTTDAVLDAFHGIDGHASAAEIARLLAASWAVDPARTLRVIWYTRSIHDGKGEREAFYRAFAWLYEAHPRTAIANLEQLVLPLCGKKHDGAHGYWKDLLNLVCLAVEGELTTRKKDLQFGFLHRFTPRRTRLPKDFDAKAARVEVAQRQHANLVDKLADNKSRALYVAVARLFAKALAKDLAILDQISCAMLSSDKATLSRELSLVGKWAPTPGGSHDRVTNLSTAIAALLLHDQALPPSDFPAAVRSAGAQAAAQHADLAHVLRSFLQRWVLRPLRAQLACPEPLMSAGRWNKINYGRVPGVCMKLNTERFFQHDPDRFQEYLISVETGERKIASATLLPHQLVAAAVAADMQLSERVDKSKYPKLDAARRELAEMKSRVAQVQWRDLVCRMRENGRLDNAIAVCDVSGSMGFVGTSRADQPIYAAIALSLLLASLAKPPFDAGFITFSSEPQFVELDLTRKSLAELVTEMSGADWGYNTNFSAVFLELLLPLAKKHAVPKEEMIKRIFVFSDMQFDEAYGQGDWETNYDAIARAYEDAGYDAPEIVFWDLSMATQRTVEVEATRKGVALMNGFSAGLMKVFLGDEEEAEGEEDWVEVKQEFNPVNVMDKAVGKQSFDGLVVMD